MVTIPGIAASQCDDIAVVSEDRRSGERQPQNQPRGWYSSDYLPHFDSPHVIQHITYRLADSLLQSVLLQMLADLKEKERDKGAHQTELRRRIETYLDAGHGSCVLRDPEIAACVVDTWLRFDGESYRLLEWVVMPNHCHVLIEPFEGIPLGKIVLSWKNYTARWINQKMGCTGTATPQCGGDDDAIHGSRFGERRSQIWQREYWDRFIRNEQHYASAKQYIVMNPVKAGLAVKPEDWPWSSARYLVERVEGK